MRHPFFPDLVTPADDELAALLGVDILRRETLHEWPLSWVQVLHLTDGARLILKSQLPPTVEPQFYAATASPLLPPHRVLEPLGGCELLAIDWIDAPLLRDAARTEADLAAHGRRVTELIGEIRGDVPVYVDVGSVQAWLETGEVTSEKLQTLLLDGRFSLTPLDGVRRVCEWMRSPAVLRTVIEHPRVAHGDLTADQVFVTSDGYRVIDWQRPVIAPTEVDLVALLVDRGFEPRRHVEREVVSVYWMLHLQWAVEAQFDLFPNARWPLFDQWAADAIAQILRWAPPSTHQGIAIPSRRRGNPTPREIPRAARDDNTLAFRRMP